MTKHYPNGEPRLPYVLEAEAVTRVKMLVFARDAEDAHRLLHVHEEAMVRVLEDAEEAQMYFAIRPADGSEVAGTEALTLEEVTLDELAPEDEDDFHAASTAPLPYPTSADFPNLQFLTKEDMSPEAYDRILAALEAVFPAKDSPTPADPDLDAAFNAIIEAQDGTTTPEEEA